jgi:hypothetical protein
MQLIIVADEDLAPLARKLAHELSKDASYSGQFWSIQHFKNNEATIHPKQPVLFLGDHELSRQYIDILPERFCAHGTRCHHEKSKAVLLAVTPLSVSPEDLGNLKKTLDEDVAELQRRASQTKSTIFIGLLAALGGPIALFYFIFSRGLEELKNSAEYKRCQYDYLLKRFILEEFETYVLGLEV